MKTHSWFPISKGLAFWFCGRCGLIRLNNHASHRAERKPCPGRETEDGR